MDKSLIAHSTFAVVASMAAYAAWKAPERTGGGEQTVVVAGDASALTEIRWREAKHNVTVRRTDGGEVRVTVVKHASNKPVAPNVGPAGADAASKGEADAAANVDKEAEAVKTQTFPGTTQAKELFNKLAPLTASRVLGEPTAEEAKTFGLDEPAQGLTLVFGSKEQKVDVGSSTYGSGDLYAKSPAGKAFLLPSSTISQLRYGASALLDRGVLGLEAGTIERVALSHGALRRELIHRNADDTDKAFYADPAEPEVKLERLGNLIDRLLRMRVTDFAEGAAPGGEPELMLELFAAKGAVGKVRLWKSDATGATVQSSRFDEPVRISRASADHVLRDLNDVLGEKKTP